MIGHDHSAPHGEAAGTLSPGSVIVRRGVVKEILKGPEGHSEGLQAFAFGGAKVREEVGGGIVGVGVAEAGIDAGGELGSGPDPLVVVEGSLAVTETDLYGVQDIIEVIEKVVIVGVSAEVGLREGVGGKEGGGCLRRSSLSMGVKISASKCKRFPLNSLVGIVEWGRSRAGVGRVRQVHRRVRMVY